jgi:tRNA pseudouridine32 synthase/23S rRNA pseudouridine746 synthase
VDLAIAKGRKGRMRPARPGETASKPARTIFRTLEIFTEGEGSPDLALLECLPETGRTHQIRVHLAHVGHPLAVDPEYGDPGPLALGAAAVSRTPLHAARLEIRHPDTGKPLAMEAPVPEDLSRALAILRGRGA